MFDKFCGETVSVIKESNRYSVDKNDPIIKQIQELVSKNNLILRIWLPGTIGTMEYRSDRINVNIVEKTKDLFIIDSIKFG